MAEEIETQPWSIRAKKLFQTIGRGGGQFIGFHLLFRLAGLVFFIPLTAWMATYLITSSGNGAISNYDISSFLLSFRGLVFLTVTASVSFALLFFEFGGLTALAIALHRERQITLAQLFRFLLVSFPKLWALSLRQFLTYLKYAIPSLAVTGVAFLLFLTKNDINYYLIAKPPQFWITVVIGIVSGLVFAVLATRRFIDWIHSVPLLLFADRSPAEALSESRELVKGRRKEILLILCRSLAILILGLALLTLVILILEWAGLSLAGDRVPFVLAVVSILAVVQTIGAALVGMVSMAALACMEARIFLKVRPEIRLPDSLVATGEPILKKVGNFLRAGWVVLLILCALIAFAATKLINDVPYDENVLVTAHRGSSITAPENTMAAILLAVEEGADFVEIDVQETKDGTVVLVHDKDLKRVFDIDKGIWEVSFEELKDLDSGGWFGSEFSDQRLATLDQVIKAVKGRAKLNIELKFNGHQQKLASEVVRIVRENDFSDQCILTSLDYAGLRRAAAAGPEIRTGVIVTSALGDVTTLECNLLSVSAGTVNRNLIDRARQKDLEIHVWTVNDVAQMNSMISLGVDSIITDDPALLNEVISERATLSNSERFLLQLADFTKRRF